MVVPNEDVGPSACITTSVLAIRVATEYESAYIDPTDAAGL